MVIDELLSNERLGLMPCGGLVFHTGCVLALHPVFQAGVADINGLAGITFKVKNGIHINLKQDFCVTKHNSTTSGCMTNAQNGMKK